MTPRAEHEWCQPARQWSLKAALLTESNWHTHVQPLEGHFSAETLLFPAAPHHHLRTHGLHLCFQLRWHWCVISCQAPYCRVTPPALQVITSLAALPHPEYNSPPGSISGADEQQQQQEQQQQPQQQQEQQSNAPQDQQQQQQLLSSHGHIVLVASTKVPQADGSPATFRLKIPKLPGYFTGTGARWQSCDTLKHM